jgi:hypothetical protein
MRKAGWGGHRVGAGRKPKPGGIKKAAVRKPPKARPTIWTIDEHGVRTRQVSNP